MSVSQPKATWSGAISIGMVNIPVKLANAVSSERISFNRVIQKGKLIERPRQCYLDSENAEVAFADFLKGYPVGDGYVIITDEELASCEAVQTKSIEIDTFVLERTVDPIYFDKPYIVFADKGGERGYALMQKAMKKQKVVAVGKFVMRTRQYVVVLRPFGNMLLATLCFYPAEVTDLTPWDEGMKDVKVTPRELTMATQLVDQLTGEFDPSQYRNEVADRVRELIEAKIAGKGIKVQHQQAVEPSSDILAAIEATMGAKKERPKKAPTGSKAPKLATKARTE